MLRPLADWSNAPFWNEVGGRYCEDCHVAEVNDAPAVGFGVRSYALNSERAEAWWRKNKKNSGRAVLWLRKGYLRNVLADGKI